MTQKELAQKSGVKQSVISDLETGNAKSTGSILELANALGVTAEELKKGVVGELITTNVVPVQARMAPVLSWVQAGNFTNVESVDMSQVTEWFPLPDDCEKCFYLKVRGVSNEPDFIEGDYIVVDPTVYYSDMQSGDIIVVRKDKDATFKKLVIESDGTRYLKAINPNFHPNIIPIDEDCYFIGQVIDSLRYTYRGKRRVRKS
ncbi:helix-turn-helix domain-containing protein [Acinetobacter baumannii]|nr:helix-turn-helix domain-containing protein [Acinetobacter baumannii]